MQFWKTLGNIFNVVVRDAPAIVAIAYPPAAPMVTGISNLVLRIEADHAGAPGVDKKTFAMDELGRTLPFVIPYLTQGTGGVLNPDEYERAISAFMDGAKAWHNAFTVPAAVPVPKP
jgi:hypothetical protein